MAFNLRSPGLPVGQSPFSQKLKPGEGVLKTPEKKAKLTKSQESFIKDPSGLGKTIEKASKPKITGKIGSDLRRQQYKDAGYKDDDTTKKAKAKTVSTIKAKDVKDVVAKKPKDSRSVDKPVEKKAPKLASTKVSAPKKEAKLTRSQKTRARGEAALASGDKKKALRLRRKFDRQAAREAKKAAKK